jgi:hypothetical protein
VSAAAVLPQVVAAALSIACAIFLLLSVGATIAFGPSTDVNVLSNFSIEGLEPLLGWYTAAVLSWAVRGGYLVCILATLLLYMHPLRSCLAQMLWPEPDRPSSHTAGPDIATASSDNEQQQSQQQPQQSPHPESSSVMAPERRLWQDLEQAVYYPLTYGLLAGIVLAAVAVTNIYQAVSFVGDIASTVQAFIVPGVLAIALVVQQRGQIRAAAAAAAAAFMPVDVERGGPAGVSTDSPAPSFKVSVPVGSVLYAAAGAFVLVLGLALFSNGVYERVDDWL